MLFSTASALLTCWNSVFLAFSSASASLPTRSPFSSSSVSSTRLRFSASTAWS